MMDFLDSLDWSPLIISLKTGVVATIISFFIGLYAARKVVKLSFKAKAVVDGAPAPVKEGVPAAEAEELKAKLEEAGATVELK